MHRYDARRTFVELLEEYIAGIETEERLARFCALVSSYHGHLTVDAADLAAAVLKWFPASMARMLRLASSASHRERLRSTSALGRGCVKTRVVGERLETHFST